MKTFKDLKFKGHINAAIGYETSAKLEFDNGYAVSVITGECAYASEDFPYEVAVLKDGACCYDTAITNDVIGYCDENKVSDIMKQIQELPNRKGK